MAQARGGRLLGEHLGDRAESQLDNTKGVVLRLGRSNAFGTSSALRELTENTLAALDLCISVQRIPI
jgi:hypothetical protein